MGFNVIHVFWDHTVLPIMSKIVSIGSKLPNICLVRKYTLILPSIEWHLSYTEHEANESWCPLFPISLHSHLWPLLLTWFNFNPSMDK